MGEGMRIATNQCTEAFVEVGSKSFPAYAGDQSFEAGVGGWTEGFIELLSFKDRMPDLSKDLEAGDRLTLDGREFVTTSVELNPRRWRISFESFAEKRSAPSIILSTDMGEAVVDFGDRKQEFVVDSVSTITEVERGAVKADGGSIRLLATDAQAKDLHVTFSDDSLFILDGKEKTAKRLSRTRKTWTVHFTAVNS